MLIQSSPCPPRRTGAACRLAAAEAELRALVGGDQVLADFRLITRLIARDLPARREEVRYLLSVASCYHSKVSRKINASTALSVPPSALP